MCVRSVVRDPSEVFRMHLSKRTRAQKEVEGEEGEDDDGGGGGGRADDGPNCNCGSAVDPRARMTRFPLSLVSLSITRYY